MDGCTKLPELPCSADAFCESPAADLARARETGHECSCCVTVADTVSTVQHSHEMQSGAHGRQTHSQVEPNTCLYCT